MTTERIDVLAVMDAVTQLNHGDDSGEFSMADVDAARAAVAELIEADRELDAALSAYCQAHAFYLGDTAYVSEDDPAVVRLDAAKARRAAALARVGGAS